MAIVHQNVTQQIVEYFTENIEAGSWKIGEKIPSENQLTSLLGVSRASVRSAVSQLAGIGVFETIQGKGTFLKDNQVKDAMSSKNKITAEDCLDVEKVLEFRRIVESEACYLATQKKTAKMIEQLEHYLAVMIESKNKEADYVTADIKFHSTIAKASGNPLLEKSLNRIFEEHRRSQEITKKTFGNRDGIHYHQLILKAIKAGDANEARAAMYAHMQNGIEKIRKQNKNN